MIEGNFSQNATEASSALIASTPARTATMMPSAIRRGLVSGETNKKTKLLPKTGCDCPSGFSGYICELPCPKGTWGPHCSHVCNGCDVCDGQTGQCRVCEKNEDGTDCLQPCPVGKQQQQCRTEKSHRPDDPEPAASKIQARCHHREGRAFNAHLCCFSESVDR